MTEEQQQQQEDENKRIRPRERARGQKTHSHQTISFLELLTYYIIKCIILLKSIHILAIEKCDRKVRGCQGEESLSRGR